MITENDQVLYMENERFAVPELLFNPSDIGVYPLLAPPPSFPLDGFLLLLL